MHFVTRYLTGSLLLVVSLLTVTAAQAQPQQGPQLTAEQIQQIQALRQQGMQLQQKISQLQQQAMQGSPALVQQSKELQDMGGAVLKAQGFDMEKTLARLQTLKAEFDKPGTTDEQKKKLQQEGIAIQQKLQQAEAAAMAFQGISQVVVNANNSPMV